MIPCLLLLAGFVRSPERTTGTAKRVCITIDDLPCANCAEGNWDQVTDDLLRTLKAHQVPAIGFVNENKLYRDDMLDSARYRMLDRWLAAGMDLGNHTFAHLGATRTSAAEFERDVVKGEEHLRPLMRGYGSEPRYFRHPFLQTGTTPQRRDTLNAMLAQRGYTIAPVTFDNDEYIHAYCYEHARRAMNDSLMQRIAGAYLDYMAEVTLFHEAQARTYFGREIPHILLIHANALNAAHLDALLAWFEEQGYTFIPLSEALKDECYSHPEATTSYGFSWIRRWQLAAGLKPAWPPEIQPWVQARYDRMRR